jgi:hypothetical protein
MPTTRGGASRRSSGTRLRMRRAMKPRAKKIARVPKMKRPITRIAYGAYKGAADRPAALTHFCVFKDFT